MSRHRKDPLRPLTADERQELTRLSRSLSDAVENLIGGGLANIDESGFGPGAQA